MSASSKNLILHHVMCEDKNEFLPVTLYCFTSQWTVR